MALVTGGSSGIGRACAEALAKDGVRVAVVDINPEGGREVAAHLGGLFVSANLSARVDCKKAVEETVAYYGRLDILVNNAGFQHLDPLPDFPEDTWDDMMALMLTAPFLLTKYAWPHLIESGEKAASSTSAPRTPSPRAPTRWAMSRPNTGFWGSCGWRPWKGASTG